MTINRHSTPNLFEMTEQMKPREEREAHRLPTLAEAEALQQRLRGTSFTARLWCVRCDGFALHDGVPVGDGVLALSCTACKQGSRLVFGNHGRLQRHYLNPDGSEAYAFCLEEVERFLERGTRRCRCWALPGTNLFLMAGRCTDRLGLFQHRA